MKGMDRPRVLTISEKSQSVALTWGGGLGGQSEDQ